ncbi:MAG: methyl-accepting chemotaxis protein [Candidatus Binatia bacterium]
MLGRRSASARGAAPVPSTFASIDEQIERVAAVCERAAAGDLEARVVSAPEHPGLARLTAAINRLLDVSDSFVREASAAMHACSRDAYHRPILLRGLRGAYRDSARTINAAGVKMQASGEEIAFAAQIAHDNAGSVSHVAAACEELTATSSEISRRTADSARLTEQTVRESGRAVQAVELLNEAARRIGGIVELIEKVAAQTNLLALNATIEAVRAGEQGKGFLVVANEVKYLSRDTATATHEIGAHVVAMRDTVRDVAEIVDGIGHAIRRIDEGASAVAESVDEQRKATAEIGRSITEVSENTRLVSERMSGRGLAM